MPYFITFFSSLIYSLLFSEHFHMCVQLYISHTQLFSFRRAHSHLVSFSVAPSDWNVVSRVHRCLYARSESFKFVYIHTHTHNYKTARAHTNALSIVVCRKSIAYGKCIHYKHMYNAHTCMNTSHSQPSTHKHMQTHTQLYIDHTPSETKWNVTNE